jgi:MATE family multidrug resistance protein
MIAGRPPRVLDEVAPTLQLAVPIALSQLGLMLMGVVDTAMVGQLGPTAVGSVGVGTSLWSATFVAGAGLLLGIDRVAAMAYGAGRPEECRRVLAHGARSAVAVGLPLTLLLMFAARHLSVLGIAPALVPDAARYLTCLSVSLMPSLLFTAVRQTLQAMGDATAPTVILLVANLVNAGGNQLFIHGAGPIPAFGVVGSAYATLACRLFSLTALAIYAWRKGIIGPCQKSTRDGKPGLTMELLRLGVPAAGQMVLEVGVFATATVLVAGLGAIPAAAHQIVLVISSFTFMVPLGTGSAGAVRVAQASGRGDATASARAGWAAIGLGVGFMVTSAIALLTFSRPILLLFTSNEPTLALAQRLLFCAALFQIFDGAQVTLGGVLRGSGDTLSPMLTNLVGHWLFGLPIGCWLGFGLHLGAFGLWVGLSSGLASVAVALLAVWSRRVARLVPLAEPAVVVPTQA